MAFKAASAEEMRSEVVRYLEFVEDRHRQNFRMVSGPQAKRREQEIANVILSLVGDFKNALIMKESEDAG